jgi:hypothetical protein
LQEDGIDSNEYYRIITERVISILKKNKNYMQEEPVSEDLKKAAKQYSFYIPTQCEATETWKKETEQHFIDGANWKKENLWKPADGDDLPEIGREVIAILDNGKVGFAHRPPEYWDGKNIVTGKVTRNYPKTYDKGGWNLPNVKWWMDCLLPNLEED